jgi:DNA-binding transcriptional ArsR family regulator
MIFNHTVEHKHRNLAEPMLDQVYDAIADPTRRAILGILAEGEANVGSVAERFPISLNGVSKHVKVLERAGLVERTVQGREHRLRLNAEPLREASMWLEHYRTFWETRLAALEAFLLKKEPGAGSERATPPREDSR